MAHNSSKKMSTTTTGYIETLRKSLARRHTRRELAQILRSRCGKELPRGINLRRYVSTWYAHQQAINNGHEPTKFWRSVVGV